MNRLFICRTVGFALAVISTLAFSQSTTKFACVGDFGTASASQVVASMIAGWNPDFVITVGDNNYTANNATVGSWDSNVGQYYGQFIHYPAGSTSAYAPGPATNKFFPSVGNHDWDAIISGWYNYFELPNNERYYDVVKGPCHFFFISSDSREPDGITSGSTQAQWLQQRLAATVSPWRIVCFHHPPYSSGSVHGNTASLQWPFAAWGASIVLSGHEHTYERVVKNGFNYIVNGLGGRSPYSFRATPEPGSLVRYNTTNGAMLITATVNSLTLRMYSVTGGGTLVDSLTLTSPPPPITLASFTGTVLSPNRVRLNWTTLSEVRTYGFEIQRRRDTLTSFTTIPYSFIPGHGTTIEPHVYSFIDSNAAIGPMSYRLRVIDSSNEITYSEPIWVNNVTSIRESRIVSKFHLEQNFPNPFNPTTTIGFSLAKAVHVTLKVYDHLGKEVVTILDRVEGAGRHEVKFDTKSLSSGSYFYRLQADGFSETKQLMLLK